MLDGQDAEALLLFLQIQDIIQELQLHIPVNVDALLEPGNLGPELLGGGFTHSSLPHQLAQAFGGYVMGAVSAVLDRIHDAQIRDQRPDLRHQRLPGKPRR